MWAAGSSKQLISAGRHYSAWRHDLQQSHARKHAQACRACGASSSLYLTSAVLIVPIDAATTWHSPTTGPSMGGQHHLNDLAEILLRHNVMS